MKGLICCESSGVVREAFRALGHDFWSCDLLPADDGSPFHLKMDMREATKLEAWDFLGFHNTCTYLTYSAEWAYSEPNYEKYPGVGYHQKVKPGTLTGSARWKARNEAVELAKWSMAHTCRWYFENPKGFLSQAIRTPDQSIQPHQFGEDASKETCLWLHGLTPLKPTLSVPPRIVNGKKRWANQTDSGQNKLTPGDNRWKERSRTYDGIALAMASQWGCEKTEEKFQLEMV